MKTDDLVAYLDNELTVEERSAVESALANDDDVLKLMADLCEQRLLLAQVMRKRASGGSPAGVPRGSPAEAAPTQRGQRVSLFSAPGMRIALGLAAAVLLLLGTVFILKNAQPEQTPVPPVIVRHIPDEGRIVEVQGDAGLTPASRATRITVAVGTVVKAGDVLTLGSSGTVTFRYVDGSTLHIYKNSRLAFADTNGAKRVELAGGALDADIMPQPADRPMTVKTAYISVRVVGTEFRLMSDEKASLLGVRKGVVDVTRNDNPKATIKVTQGGYAAVSDVVPFMRLPTSLCPYWKGQCMEKADSKYQ